MIVCFRCHCHRVGLWVAYGGALGEMTSRVGWAADGMGNGLGLRSSRNVFTREFSRSRRNGASVAVDDSLVAEKHLQRSWCR